MFIEIFDSNTLEQMLNNATLQLRHENYVTKLKAQMTVAAIKLEMNRRKHHDIS